MPVKFYSIKSCPAQRLVQTPEASHEVLTSRSKSGTRVLMTLAGNYENYRPRFHSRAWTLDSFAAVESADYDAPVLLGRIQPSFHSGRGLAYSERDDPTLPSHR